MSLSPAHWHNCTFESFLIRMSNLRNHYYSTTTTYHWKQGSKPEELKLSLLKRKQQKLTLWSLSVVVLLNFETWNMKLSDLCGFNKS